MCVDRAAAFASKPAPTVDRILPEETRSTVGAGLLAKRATRLSRLPRLLFAPQNRTGPRHECRRPVTATSLWPFA
ncbi:hypothetical protein C0J56_25365 [Pseudomonas fluorescens]|nr:hypothetical protein C0J56_25365 [Pseudomonas fluorescens]